MLVEKIPRSCHHHSSWRDAVRAASSSGTTARPYDDEVAGLLDENDRPNHRVVISPKLTVRNSTGRAG